MGVVKHQAHRRNPRYALLRNIHKDSLCVVRVEKNSGPLQTGRASALQPGECYILTGQSARIFGAAGGSPVLREPSSGCRDRRSDAGFVKRGLTS